MHDGSVTSHAVDKRYMWIKKREAVSGKEGDWSHTNLVFINNKRLILITSEFILQCDS